jgi:hypothetical protein
MSDIYALVTTRVPFPKTPAFFALRLLTCYCVAMALQDQLAAVGLDPVTVALISTYTLNLWRKTPQILGDQDADIVWGVMALMLALCAAILFAPSLIWLQRGYSFGLILIVVGFLMQYKADGPDSFSWFAQHWRCGQRNAANWHVARLAALLACNEAIIQHGTATEWVISIAILPIAMYYLMYWTILATHPYEDDPAPHDP